MGQLAISVTLPSIKNKSKNMWISQSLEKSPIDSEGAGTNLSHERFNPHEVNPDVHSGKTLFSTLCICLLNNFYFHILISDTFKHPFLYQIWVSILQLKFYVLGFFFFYLYGNKSPLTLITIHTRFEDECIQCEIRHLPAFNLGNKNKKP